MLWIKLKATLKQFFKNYLLWATIITWLLTIAFKCKPNYCEALYSNGVYKIIAVTFSTLSKLIPFSLNDLFFSILCLAFISVIVLLILKTMKLKKALKLVIKSIAITYVMFYWLWGFNYFRLNIHERIGLSKHVINDSVFIKTYNTIVANAINAYVHDSIFNAEQINHQIEQSFKDLSDELKLSYPNGIRRPKSMIYSKLIAGAGISGYFGPFFNEIHINKLLLPVQYPVILAHEKAHQFGITSEAEASFYAWVICNNSEMKQVKYSANIYLIRYFLNQVKDETQYKTFINKLPPEIKSDLKEIKHFWREMNIPVINNVQSTIYDIYLKGNNISDGVKNYGGVVKLVCQYEQYKSMAVRTNKNP